MLGHVVILGPGLLGGSLALACAELGLQTTVWGRRAAPLDFLHRAAPALHTEVDLPKALQDADLLVLATPVGVMPGLLEEVVRLQNLRPEATITDVGSVKAPIVHLATQILRETSYHFVGSHPMAGSEASGVEAARPGLFQDALCILTPEANTHPRALQQATAFWQKLQGRVHQLTPETHDEIAAHVSHMPHALASLIVRASLHPDPEHARFAGRGLHDTTRIASGEPSMWTEILLENRQAVLQALQGARRELDALIDLIDRGEKDNLQRFLLEAKELRDTHIVPER